SSGGAGGGGGGSCKGGGDRRGEWSRGGGRDRSRPRRYPGPGKLRDGRPAPGRTVRGDRRCERGLERSDRYADARSWWDGLSPEPERAERRRPLRRRRPVLPLSVRVRPGSVSIGALEASGKAAGSGSGRYATGLGPFRGARGGSCLPDPVWRGARPRGGGAPRAASVGAP